MQSWSTSYTHRAEQIKYYRRDNTKTMGLVFLSYNISLHKPCQVPQAQIPATWKSETGGFQVKGLPGIQSEFIVNLDSML